jgi:FtsH-binding integral membrane protein
MSAFNQSPFQQQGQGFPLDYGAQAGSPAVASFFNSVYAWMCAGLALTAVVAGWVSVRPDVMLHIFNGPALIGLFIAQIVLVGVISAATRRLSATVATALFLLYAALMGLTLSGIFLVYTAASIAGAFVASAAMFGVMSFIGMVTKADLSGLGKLMFMGLIGLIVASLVNVFFAHGAITWLLSYIGVVIFVGLTAYDTQRLKQFALATAGDQAMASRLAVNGALMLYLDFLNLFLFLLQIMGQGRRR